MDASKLNALLEEAGRSRTVKGLSAAQILEAAKNDPQASQYTEGFRPEDWVSLVACTFGKFMRGVPLMQAISECAKEVHDGAGG